MIDPPKVLLEQSFMRAVIEPDHPDHRCAVAGYLSLIGRFESQEVLLVAVSDHLKPFRGLARQGAFTPVDHLWVGFQHRRAARRSTFPDDEQFALTLVMCDRHRVRHMATFDPRFEQFQLAVVGAGDPSAAPAAHDEG